MKDCPLKAEFQTFKVGQAKEGKATKKAIAKLAMSFERGYQKAQYESDSEDA